jgi:hypothetical protein
MAVFMKTIKPKRFAAEVFRQTMLARLKTAGVVVKKDFESTTKSWEHKVDFEVLVDVLPDGPTLLVGTDDKIYGYVSKGTGPHEIWAGAYTGKSDKTKLSFQWGGSGSYIAKTVPGVIGSREGGPTGDKVAFAHVSHPGTSPRNFEELIQKARSGWFQKQMQQAMKEAARASGHGM